MRILLINHYAGSPGHGMEYRPYYFAREWVRAGHSVLIVAASFSHLRQKNPDVRGTLTCETIDGVDYLWVRTPRYSGNGASRVANMVTFLVRLYGACRKSIAEFRPDLVIASSTYTWDNWSAAHFARKYGARYVYELHDVWPLTPMELAGMSRWHPFVWTLQKAEDFACRTANKVVSLLPAAQPHLTERGMPPERFAYIPNGVVLSEWTRGVEQLPLLHREAIDQVRRQGRFLLGYLGGHALSNALHTLIEAAVFLERQNVSIILVGEGVEKERLVRLAKALGLQHTVFLPSIPKALVPSLLTAMDACYIGWSRSPLYRFGICPNKLLDYMMAAKPVIQAIEAANNLVAEAACGITIPPENTAAIIDAAEKLIRLSPAERQAMGQRGKDYVTAHHDYTVLAQHFLEVVSEN